MNSPSGVAVDAVGNIYIADTNNDLIREVNFNTGVINTIAGIAPTGCSGTTCSSHYSGCANGVPAYGTGIEAHLTRLPWTRLKTCTTPTSREPSR